ncbi:protein of unknown function [Lachnospiraceae bacterium XPB1003]|nr:protein of unknown function [Lachnospiraceae bacterium XPB1003]
MKHRYYFQEGKHYSTGGYNKYGGDGDPNELDKIEAQANYAATAFLMPRAATKKLARKMLDYKNERILFGHISRGFAQGLADKLEVPIKAPTEYLWATPLGSYFVRKGKMVDNELVPDFLSDKGTFKIFYPKGGKRI